MATIDVKDAAGTTVAVEKPLIPGRALAAASRPVALSTEDLAALTALATKLDTLVGHVDGLEGSATTLNGLVDGLETLITATNAALATLAGHVDGLEGFSDGIETLITATNAALTTIAGHVDGLETLIGSTNTALGTLAGHVDGLEGFTDGIEALLTTLAGHVDGLEAATATVGTRSYAAGGTRVAYSGTSAQSAAITATEVLLHNCGSARCFVAAGSNPTATVNDIPLETGEKFHLRITSGHKIAVLQDSASGNLNVVAVA